MTSSRGPLFDQVARFDALRKAALVAARGHGASRPVAAFLADLERECLALERELLAGAWWPRPLSTFRIRDPKPRTISAAAFRDRVVHHAVCAVLAPRFEARADPDSYACRPGRGNHAAVRRTQALCRRHEWYAKLDIRHFFETVPHAPLRARVAAVAPDPALLELLDRILAVGASGPGPVGLPIGNLTSQHFGNFYLGALDQYARRTLRVPAMVRYMDDVLVFGPDKATVRRWADAVGAWVPARLGLEVKTEATVVAPVRVGLPFLGFRVWPRLLRLDGARARRFRRRLRTLARLLAAGVLTEAQAQRRGGAVVAWAAHGDTLRFRQRVVGDVGVNGVV